MTFGDFITEKRKAKGLIYRDIAEALDISLPYISDVEKGRRNAFEKDKLEKLSAVLGLTDEEKTFMFDLAGQQRQEVSPDLPEYIMERDYVRYALRTARDLKADESEWLEFVEELKRRKG